MARGIELGQHADTAIVRVGNQTTNFVLRVIQTIGTHFVQLRKLLGLDAEALVVGKMQVQNVHLHRCHSIQIALKHIDRNKVAANVNEQSAPGEPRLILYRSCRHSKSIHARFDQLQKGLKSVKNAQRIGGVELRSRLADCQLIRLILAQALHLLTAMFQMDEE